MSAVDKWMPLYVADYLADTVDLTAEQHGCYLLLLMYQWRRGPIPDDDADIATICRITRTHWQRHVAGKLRPFFHVRAGRGGPCNRMRC